MAPGVANELLKFLMAVWLSSEVCQTWSMLLVSDFLAHVPIAVSFKMTEPLVCLLGSRTLILLR
jgi:protein gp37